MGLSSPDRGDCIGPLWARLRDRVTIIRKQQLASPKEIKEERKLPAVTVVVTSLPLPSLLSLLWDSLHAQLHPMTLPNARMLAVGQTFYCLLSDYKLCCDALCPRFYPRNV